MGGIGSMEEEFESGRQLESVNLKIEKAKVIKEGEDDVL